MSAASATENYAAGPLPEHLTVAGWRVGLIVSSFAIALPGFLNGAQTGLALGFWPAVLAALFAGIGLCAGGCLTSVVSVRTRLTTYLLVQRSFGLRGAALVNVVIAIVHFCWFGVNVSFFGNAMLAATGGVGNVSTYLILGAVLMTVSTIYGFRTLEKVALVAVPLLAAILIGVCIAAVRRHGVVLAASPHPPEPMSFGIAVSAIVGGNMLAITTMPDLSRFVRTAGGSIFAMILSFPFATPLLMVASALPALATGETDIMKLIVEFGFGTPVLFAAVLSIWTINASNLYSASLSLTATFPKVKQWVFILLGGGIGTIFALAGIIDEFIPFLLFLGLIIPPIAAIYVIDGFTTFAGKDAGETLRTMPALRWEAVATWLGSIFVAVFASYRGVSLTTVPTLDATIVAAVVYTIVLRVRRPR